MLMAALEHGAGLYPEIIENASSSRQKDVNIIVIKGDIDVWR